MACNAILARLGTNYVTNYEKETSAYQLWTSLSRDYKLWGAGILNDYYRRLGALTLVSYKDVGDYVSQFKELYTNIYKVYPITMLPTSHQIFLFYIELGREHQDYFTQYTQNHNVIQDDKFAYTIEYTINRFL